MAAAAAAISGPISSFIDEELELVKNQYSDIPGAELIACHPMAVRVKIWKTKLKTLTVCIQFPENYPDSPLLIELKSSVMSEKLLDGLTKLCEQECKNFLRKKQVMTTLYFVKHFIDDNPLCVCSEEISYIKKDLLTKVDEIKLKQKTSNVTIKICQDQYFIKINCTVPDHYYNEQLQLELVDHNFPEVFSRYFFGYAVEITRRCVQPPIKKNPKDPPFQPKPSLKLVADFLFTCVRRYPTEQCALCNKNALPANPKEIIKDPLNDEYIERVYCGHIYHKRCMDLYFKTPPFEGGKKCPKCNKRIYHDKWRVTPQIAEARWAHQQARQRELDEVVDFLQ
ncbi:uncharacterized protein LOC141909586 [Tubulanus polymorphus]|uniref:uncharacterized protein LOC141909586 n=1 Tax=Tubulanus polymorphus TaxID=672921 RepID=UPI003DA2EBB8